MQPRTSELFRENGIATYNKRWCLTTGKAGVFPTDRFAVQEPRPVCGCYTGYQDRTIGTARRRFHVNRLHAFLSSNDRDGFM